MAETKTDRVVQDAVAAEDQDRGAGHGRDHEDGVLLRGFPHAEEIGMRTHDVSGPGEPPGAAMISIPYSDKLVGASETGVVHGGVITTLLDTGCGIAAIVRTGRGAGIATLDLRIDYMRPARPGRALWARCECYRVTRSVAFARGVAYDDDADDPVATAAGAFMITGIPKEAAS